MSTRIIFIVIIFSILSIYMSKRIAFFIIIVFPNIFLLYV